MEVRVLRMTSDHAASLELRQILAENIRRVRQALQLSQRQINGLAQKTVSAIELGTQNPTLSTIGRLSSCCGVPASLLLTRKPAE